MRDRYVRKDIRKITAACVIAFAFIVIPQIFFSDINEPDIQSGLQPPGIEHFFGTDNLGRDLLLRSLDGLKLSLLLAFAVQIISVCMGVVIGILVTYFGGVADKIYIMVQNVIMSFPSIIAALSMILLLGTGLHSLVIALCVTDWISYARIVRSEVITVRQLDYIHGSRAVGTSDFRILFKHVLPNVINPVIPIFTLMIGHTVLSISGLGFLGFGVQPPAAEIGLMIRDGLSYIGKAPWMFMLPGLMLVVYSLLFNILGDKMQDALSPQSELYMM